MMEHQQAAWRPATAFLLQQVPHPQLSEFCRCPTALGPHHGPYCYHRAMLML